MTPNRVNLVDLNLSTENETSNDPYIARLEKKLELMESDPDITFDGLEFELYNDYIKRKEQNLEDPTNQLMEYRIKDMESECLFLKVQNEIFEKFIKKTNYPLYTKKFKEPHRDPVKVRAEHEEEIQKMEQIQRSNIQLNSKEILSKVQKGGDGKHETTFFMCKENCSVTKILANIAREELGELYRQAKKRGIENNKTDFELLAQKGSLLQKIKYLEESLLNFNKHFEKILDKKKASPGFMIMPEVAYKYFQEQGKEIDNVTRTYTVGISKINRQLMDIHDWRSSCSHITAADLDVLQVECVQLEQRLERNEEECKKLRSLLGC